MARGLIREHFSVVGLPNQIHSDNGAKFINNLWVELFSKLKILHTRTPPYNPSSNMQNEWDLGVKAACLAYNTTVHASTGQT